MRYYFSSWELKTRPPHSLWLLEAFNLVGKTVTCAFIKQCDKCFTSVRLEYCRSPQEVWHNSQKIICRGWWAYLTLKGA